MKLIILGTLLFAAVAMAGDKDVGNGGNVVVCGAASETPGRVELLDFYEGRVIRDFIVEMGGDELTVDQKVQYALDRLSKTDLSRATFYKKELEGFWKNTKFLAKVTIPEIPDAGPLPIPEGCELAQIAFQRNVDHPMDFRYIIRKDLWDRLDKNNQAGLVLHEIAYREALRYGHPNSVSARYFVGLIGSSKMHDISVAQYVQAVRSLPFSWVSIHGIPVHLSKDYKQYENGMIQFAKFASEYTAVPGQVVDPTGNVISVSLKAGEGWIGFNETSSIKSLRFSSVITKFQYESEHIKIEREIDGGLSLRYYSNGGLESVSGTTGDTLPPQLKTQSHLKVNKLDWSGDVLQSGASPSLVLDENGQLKALRIEDGQFLIAGKWYPISGYHRFDAQAIPVAPNCKSIEIKNENFQVVHPLGWKKFSSHDDNSCKYLESFYTDSVRRMEFRDGHRVLVTGYITTTVSTSGYRNLDSFNIAEDARVPDCNRSNYKASLFKKGTRLYHYEFWDGDDYISCFQNLSKPWPKPGRSGD